MAYDNIEQKPSAFSKIVRAGKRRTYFFDIKESRANDYYLIITESRKRFDNNGYDKSKIFIYKEDFNKFANTLQEVVNYAKTELMPDFNFDEFNHDNYVKETGENTEVEPLHANIEEPIVEEISSVKEDNSSTIQQQPPLVNSAHESVDKW